MTTNPNSFDVIIVGAGVAGLTAGAYLTKANKKVLLIEKEDHCGGLVNSFEDNGYIFDGGIRALENAGVLFPMLRQLGIDLHTVPNDVTIGIGQHVIALENKSSLNDYQNLLCAYFPDNHDDIEKIITAMKQIAHFMDIQYGIDNPMFLDPVKDKKYFLTDVFPWIFKFLFTSRKVAALDIQVRTYLQKFTHNQALIDVIAQHFFTDTPASFALSYLTLYLDYHYPIGGTGQFSNKLENYITEHGGYIQTSTKVVKVEPNERIITDSDGNEYSYRSLIWAADQQTFYNSVKTADVENTKTTRKIAEKKKLLQNAKGNDSVLTVYIEADLHSAYFSEIASSHFFYSPTVNGDSIAGEKPLGKSKDDQQKWLDVFFANTTYEIAIPVLRDATLAPKRKTGLIISVLFDYGLTAEIEANGWYEDFKLAVQKEMIAVLDSSIFPGLKNRVEKSFCFTPLSIEKRAGTYQGAITGWSFTDKVTPAETSLVRINAAVKTPFNNIFQAGMWTYSPAGFPVSLITGKLAAEQALKTL